MNSSSLPRKLGLLHLSKWPHLPFACTGQNPWVTLTPFFFSYSATTYQQATPLGSSISLLIPTYNQKLENVFKFIRSCLSLKMFPFTQTTIESHCNGSQISAFSLTQSLAIFLLSLSSATLSLLLFPQTH